MDPKKPSQKRRTIQMKYMKCNKNHNWKASADPLPVQVFNVLSCEKSASKKVAGDEQFINWEIDKYFPQATFRVLCNFLKLSEFLTSPGKVFPAKFKWILKYMIILVAHSVYQTPFPSIQAIPLLD